MLFYCGFLILFFVDRVSCSCLTGVCLFGFAFSSFVHPFVISRKWESQRERRKTRNWVGREVGKIWRTWRRENMINAYCMIKRISLKYLYFSAAIDKKGKYTHALICACNKYLVGDSGVFHGINNTACLPLLPPAARGRVEFKPSLILLCSSEHLFTFLPSFLSSSLFPSSLSLFLSLHHLSLNYTLLVFWIYFESNFHRIIPSGALFITLPDETWRHNQIKLEARAVKQDSRARCWRR